MRKQRGGCGEENDIDECSRKTIIMKNDNDDNDFIEGLTQMKA